jgi:hypothetical protein
VGELALAFAAAGFPVFPVRVFWNERKRRWRKRPLPEDDWNECATTDAEQIAKWWSKWPFAMVGVRARKAKSIYRGGHIRHICVTSTVLNS